MRQVATATAATAAAGALEQCQVQDDELKQTWGGCNGNRK